MKELPLYSKELKLIRGSTSVVQMAKKVRKSREFVRLVETGKLVPSYEVFEVWLCESGCRPEDRNDILRSMLQEKAFLCKVAEDLDKIRSIAFEDYNPHSEELINEIADVVMEVGGLKEGMRDGQLMRIRKIFEKHRG